MALAVQRSQAVDHVEFYETQVKRYEARVQQQLVIKMGCDDEVKVSTSCDGLDCAIYADLAARNGRTRLFEFVVVNGLSSHATAKT